MSGLVLVADDLTGALDSAVHFCSRSGRIPVYLGSDTDAAPHPHAAFDLATRDASAAFAVQATRHIAPRLAAADIAFKKIDSLLRGHWAVELHALMASGAFRTCVFAPALPSQGRATINGRQWVSAAGSAPRAVEVDPAGTLRGLGLDVVQIAPSAVDRWRAADAAGTVRIFDASSDDDLRAIVGWGRAQVGPVLWCGTAGLARALAACDPPQAISIDRPVLVIVGTHHAVSRDQVAYAARHMPQSRVTLNAGPSSWAGAGAHSAADGALRRGGRENDLHAATAAAAAVAADDVAAAIDRSGACLLTFRCQPDTPAPRAADFIEQALAGVLPRVRRPATLAVTGGSTLLAVCKALDVDRLDVEGEFAPGVPRSRLVAGLWDGIELVSKSGAFGPPELLHRILADA